MTVVRQRFPFRTANHWEAGFRAGLIVASLIGASLACAIAAIR
jgi:hypothetical protein